MQLWWDLVSPDGYGYNWGRSLGVVSYLDTLEIVAFLAANPELRPAPLADLASEYRLAWIWLRDNYDANRHMLQVFAPGRGNYAYITKEREWQQNVGFFGKALMAQDTLMRVLAAENASTSFPSAPAPSRRRALRVLPPRRSSVRRLAGAPGPAAFRACRSPPARSPAIADYLPAPHGLPGFVGAGRTDRTRPARRTSKCRTAASSSPPTAPTRSFPAPTDDRCERPGGASSVVGGKTGEWIEPGFEVTVAWRIYGATLERTETLTAQRDVTIKRLSWLLSSSATTHSADGTGGFTLTGPEGRLTARSSGALTLSASVQSFGDEPLGRGPRVPIPTHVTYEAKDIQLRPGRPQSWTISLTASAPIERIAR